MLPKHPVRVRPPSQALAVFLLVLDGVGGLAYIQVHGVRLLGAGLGGGRTRPRRKRSDPARGSSNLPATEALAVSSDGRTADSDSEDDRFKSYTASYAPVA